MPLDVAGLIFCRSATNARRFSFKAPGSKFARPIWAWMMPALSVRYRTWPDFAFLTAPATSGVTVPTFGFGIRPRGPKIWPSWPTMRIASGLAITTSKSICPALTFSARSSKPTMSAPAALAASTFLPCVKTATRTVLPVPWGITVEPRTCWSDLVASTPKLTDTSTDSLNFAVANSLTSLSASSIGYDLPGGSFSFQVLVRLATAGMSHSLRVDAHAAGAAGDRAHGGIQIRGGHIRHLHLGDVFELLARDLADLRRVGRRAAFRYSERLRDQHRGRRRLHNEREAAVAVDRDHDRRGQTFLQRLGLGIECLAELHDVHALLTQRRANRRAWIGLTCRDLQLDVARYFLRHLPLLWVLAPVRQDELP